MILIMRGDNISLRAARICGSCLRKKRCPWRTAMPCSTRFFTADFVRSQEIATKLIDRGCAITDEPRAPPGAPRPPPTVINKDDRIRNTGA